MKKKIIAMLLVIAFVMTPICNVNKPCVVQKIGNKTSVSIDGRQYDVTTGNGNITVESNTDKGKVSMVLDLQGNAQICSCDSNGQTKKASMKIDEMSENNLKAVVTYEDGTTKRYNSIDDLNVHSYSGRGVASAFALTAAVVTGIGISTEALIAAAIAAGAIVVRGIVYERLNVAIDKNKISGGKYYRVYKNFITNELHVNIRPISFEKAAARVVAKLDVYTPEQYDAEKLARVAGGKFKGPEIDKYETWKMGAYYPHYHPEHRKSHIYFGNPVYYNCR